MLEPMTVAIWRRRPGAGRRSSACDRTSGSMTAIAASKHPARLDLFRRVLIASASIPGMFAPTFIDVESDGKRFAEMHVDGGVISNVGSRGLAARQATEPIHVTSQALYHRQRKAGTRL